MQILNSRLFGTYLIQHHGIDAKLITLALDEQKRQQTSLECLSREHTHHLNQYCLSVIRHHQVKSNKQFESVVLELGMLTQSQVNNLLDMQNGSRQKLGEILVRKGVMAERQKQDMLNQFESWLEASMAMGAALSVSQKM